MRRPAVFAAIVMLALLTSTARAQDFYVSTNFHYRCAEWGGSVSGGVADVDICFSAGPDLYGAIPGTPSADPETGYFACLYLRKPLTAAPHSVCGEPKYPGAPTPIPHPAPFVMDPAMNQAVIDFSLTGGCGVISVKLTLTGTGVPEPSHGAGMSIYESDGSVSGGAGGGLGAWRDATSTGTITSACRGTASLSAPNGYMYESVSASAYTFDEYF